jgi:hypothetical protein
VEGQGGAVKKENLWQKFLKVSLWIASAGLMVASSGLDGAYLSKLMPERWAVLGLVLNFVADVTSEIGMYWYGRLRMDKSSLKKKGAIGILVGQGILVFYAWLFGWRQLVPIVARVDPTALWMAPAGAAFIPLALIVVGYTQALLAGRIETVKNTQNTTTEIEKEEEPQPIAQPEPVQSERLVFDPAWPEAKIGDAKRVWAGANGERAGTYQERKEYLHGELHKQHLRMPAVSKSTESRWVTTLAKEVGGESEQNIR